MATKSRLEEAVETLKEYMAQRQCFGLKVESDICAACWLKAECPEYREARLTHENAALEEVVAASELEAELSAYVAATAPVVEEVPAVVEEAPPVVEEVPAVAPRVLPSSLKAPRVFAGWDWNTVAARIIGARPGTYREAFEIVKRYVQEIDPHGWEHSGAPSCYSNLQKFLAVLEGKGVVAFDKSTKVITWRA